MYRQSSVKIPPIKNISSNNSLHIFHPSIFTQKIHVKKFYYLMCPPLPTYCHNIEINMTKNRHFALAYSLGKTRLSFIRSTEQEPSIYNAKSCLFLCNLNWQSLPVIIPTLSQSPLCCSGFGQIPHDRDLAFFPTGAYKPQGW